MVADLMTGLQMNPPLAMDEVLPHRLESSSGCIAS
jgi:hypothetical protein